MPLDDVTVSQDTLVYAPGLNVGGAIVNDGNDDASIPAPTVRSVTWYGNNPENVTGATLATTEIVGTDGRYNRVGPFVNLAASTGKTLTFDDVKFHGQNAATPQIAQFNAKSYIRYNMRNALSVNDSLDENTDWTGTVALKSWELVGATAARQFGFDVKAGTLYLDDVQKAGYALFGIRQGATLSFGEKARDFRSKARIVFESDARICVKPLASDLVDSQALAEAGDAVVTLDSITYTGLGTGSDHETKRLEIQVDLAHLNLSGPVDKWAKVISSNQAPEWENIILYDTSTGHNETAYKVRVMRPGLCRADSAPGGSSVPSQKGLTQQQ
jgi:hypothetical protein